MFSRGFNKIDNICCGTIEGFKTSKFIQNLIKQQLKNNVLKYCLLIINSINYILFGYLGFCMGIFFEKKSVKYLFNMWKINYNKS